MKSSRCTLEWRRPPPILLAVVHRTEYLDDITPAIYLITSLNQYMQLPASSTYIKPYPDRTSIRLRLYPPPARVLFTAEVAYGKAYNVPKNFLGLRLGTVYTNEMMVLACSILRPSSCFPFAPI